MATASWLAWSASARRPASPSRDGVVADRYGEAVEVSAVVESGRFPPEGDGFLAGLERLGPASGLGQPDGVVTDRCGEVGEVGRRG